MSHVTVNHTDDNFRLVFGQQGGTGSDHLQRMQISTPPTKVATVAGGGSSSPEHSPSTADFSEDSVDIKVDVIKRPTGSGREALSGVGSRKREARNADDLLSSRKRRFDWSHDGRSTSPKEISERYQNRFDSGGSDSHDVPKKKISFSVDFLTSKFTPSKSSNVLKPHAMVHSAGSGLPSMLAALPQLPLTAPPGIMAYLPFMAANSYLSASPHHLGFLSHSNFGFPLDRPQFDACSGGFTPPKVKLRHDIVKAEREPSPEPIDPCELSDSEPCDLSTKKVKSETPDRTEATRSSPCRPIPLPSSPPRSRMLDKIIPNVTVTSSVPAALRFPSAFSQKTEPPSSIPPRITSNSLGEPPSRSGPDRFGLVVSSIKSENPPPVASDSKLVTLRFGQTPPSTSRPASKSPSRRKSEIKSDRCETVGQTDDAAAPPKAKAKQPRRKSAKGGVRRTLGRPRIRDLTPVPSTSQPEVEDLSKKTDSDPLSLSGIIGDSGWVFSPDGRHKQRNYKNMTRERRIEANARERTRVHTISSAYETLRRTVPSYSSEQKLSKLSVLRIAASYIVLLSRLAGDDYSSQQNRPSLIDCVDDLTSTIQTEAKIKRKKDD